MLALFIGLIAGAVTEVDGSAEVGERRCLSADLLLHKPRIHTFMDPGLTSIEKVVTSEASLIMPNERTLGMRGYEMASY